MAYEIIEIDGDVMRVRISGVMRLSDQNELQSKALNLIEAGRKPRLLVATEDFEGWEKGAGWDDVGFLIDHGDQVVKIAIVGEDRWKEQAFLYIGKGLRATEVEFYTPDLLQEAETWLTS